MIKQNWNISVEEQLRILNLHETATKNQYITKEQKEVVVGQETKTEEKKFPMQKLGDKFEYGVYDSPNVKMELERLKPQIEDFIKNTDANQFVVNISAGESRVTNPEKFKEKGSLALERARSVKKYFEELFPEQVRQGKIIIQIPNSVKEVKIGETPYGGPGSNDFTDPQKKRKYKEEQFVNFDIVGSGQKTTSSTVTKFLCDTPPLQTKGKSLESNADYTQIVPWSIGKGEGLVYLTFETFSMPDIIYFEYNGKMYGNTKFNGNKTDPYRIFVGTSLNAKYGTSELPNQMAGNTIEVLNPNDDRIINSLKTMKDWGLFDSFKNTFGQNQQLSNPNWMNAFSDFDQTGNRRKLLRDLGNTFPWAILTTEMGGSVQRVGPIEKINGVDEIKVYNVAPVGTTEWTLSLKCEAKV